ncbi:MAG: hypothetical protein LBE02_00370 [Spirochaetaceae bacterium]|nr:hypothetical protein [Spirochaetaceae bacterium]
MVVSQKAALSLLISVILVAGFSVLAFTGFFNLIETHFYNPSITNGLTKEVERDAQAVQDILNEQQEQFGRLLEDPAIRRSFLPNQSAQDIFERTRLYGILMESQKGLQSVRFIDTGGTRIHFSTDPGDILSQNNQTISYKNYDEIVPYVPYADLAVSSEGTPKITLDQKNDRIVFSFPFNDSMNIYRGTVMYSLSIRAIADRLIAAGRLKVGEDFSIISVPPGIAGLVSGLPNAGRDVIIPIISSVWQDGLLGLTALDSQTSASTLALISAKTGQGLIMGRVVDETLFAFPQSMKVILLVSIFLTLFLSIFLGFNLRADTMTVIQNRLKGLQLSLIREYYERKGEMDWDHWYRELEQRREDVRDELKRGLTDKTTPVLLEDIDTLIDKSWDEILTAIGGKRETRLAIDEDKLQNILNRMLLAAGTSPVLPGGGQAAQETVSLIPGLQQARGPAPEEVPVFEYGDEPEEENPEAQIITREAFGEDAEELEELEELEDAGEAAGLQDAEGAPEAGLQDAEEAPEVEELQDAEEAPEVEELEDAEEAPEVEEAEELPEIPAAVKSGPAPEEKPQKSNIQLVFGDDDIPTIVETAGLELVDEMDMGNRLEAEAELEDLDQVEELEEAEAGAGTSSQAPDSQLDEVSLIEFSGAEKETEEPDFDEDFEIISPFTSMLSKFDDKETFKAEEEEPQAVKTSGKLEELVENSSMSLVHVPFQAEDQSEPEELAAVKPGVIKYKNGISYVDEKVKTPDEETAKNLDQGLKNLVDSVIGKK